MQRAGGAGHLGAYARALVAAAHEETHRYEAGQERRAALADEGEREARERDEPRHAAHDDERLEHDHGGEAHGHERADVALRARRRHEAADGQAQEQQQHAGRAQKADLFCDGREDEVALNDGDLFGQAAPDADAEQVAVGDGVDALYQLVAGVLGVRERVQPVVHAHLHVTEGQVGSHAADGNEAQAHHQVELLARGHVQHDQEQEEEHERAAQVLLEHDDDQRHQPHEQQWQ